MNAILYRYNSICEPDIIITFERLGLNVIEIKEEMTNKKISASERIKLVSESISAYNPLFVFSINFFPGIADVCNITHVPYISWSVDSPVTEYFSTSILHSTNRIFLFDRAQYERFHKYNPQCIYHMPLASATERFDKTIAEITPSDRSRFSHDICFVGSLYSERNPLKGIELSDYNAGFIDALVNAQFLIIGHCFTESAITEACIDELKRLFSTKFTYSDTVENPDRYIAAHSIINYDIAEYERTLTLNTLAEYFDVTLYTKSDRSPLSSKVKVPSDADTLTEMPKIFYLSKINLNMTLRSIQKGLPLRIFDILGCGGFLMTNYQDELNDYFEIGKDLEAYSSFPELVDKCDYYLSHDSVRNQIRRSGYEKVKHQHTYYHRLARIIRKCTDNIQGE